MTQTGKSLLLYCTTVIARINVMHVRYAKFRKNGVKWKSFSYIQMAMIYGKV